MEKYSHRELLIVFIIIIQRGLFNKNVKEIIIFGVETINEIVNKQISI